MTTKIKQINGVFANWNFDIRVIPRNLDEGILSAQEVKTMLGGLPDVASKADPIHTPLPGHDDYDDMDDDEEDDA